MKHNALLLLVGAASIAALLPSSRARACGGLVSEQGSVNQDGQVSLLVLNDNTTDVFLSLNVPDASQPFGVLIPVPSQPTIDANPVDATSLDALDQATRPTIILPQGGGDGGFFACGTVAGANKDARNSGAVADPSVDIGAVNATWLSGASGQTPADWLAQQGFTLPDGGQAILDGYVNTQGMSFLAIKRSDTGAQRPANGAPVAVSTRVGVHFTLDGVHPAYALQMLKLGGTDPISVTVLVAKKDGGVGPDTPYKAITVDQLDQDEIDNVSYASAVQKGVAAVGGKAFVVETVQNVDDIAPGNALVPATFTITRLSTVLAAKDLDADVTFTSKAPSSLDPSNAAAAAGFTMPSGPSSRGLGDAAMLLAFATLLVTLARKKTFARAFA